ncbi:MAG TPA: hypothetical protein VN428_06665 [Bryobacteraceae bacterium]|nr:hypothetical protein [Bryobacteraceae bacterium]
MVEIEQEHPEYTAKRAMWRTYRDLYSGGEQFKANAAEYLVARHREKPGVYGDRLSRVFYENYIGSIIDWYAATLFRREPILAFEGQDERAKQFFCDFTEDCDRQQSALSDFFRRMITEALISGASYALVDFPKADKLPANRAEEDALGLSRAYLTAFGAESLVNWSEDDHGEFEWAVLRSDRLKQNEDRRGTEMETRWQYFDRACYRVYRKQGKAGAAELVDEGRHGLAGQNRVPLFRLAVSDGMWLMNKAGLLQLEHFNKSNALGWALTQGLFAMPVIYSERPFQQAMGDSYYIQLGPNDRFGWTEPEGHVFQIAVENLTRLKDEIHRVCYMMPQARDAAAPASALSKQRDFTITQEVLRAYGDSVKDTMKRILRSIAVARADAIGIDVSGLDEFDIGDFSADVEDARKLLELGIPSETLKREVFKKLAHKYLCDVRQNTKDRVSEEIENG